MVEIQVRIRPTSAYNSAGKLRSVRVDTSQRIEDILANLKLDKKGQYFYVNGREVPMNSSLASHNVQDGDILESCPCPKFSAALSAVMRDLDAIEKLPSDARTEAAVRPLLDGASLDPWPDRWSHEDIKPRTICLATIKKIIQRNGRYANLIPPACQTLEELMEFMQGVWGGESRRFNSNVHIVKKVNRNGQPTTCWELLQNKLAKLARISATVGQNEDPLEAFIKADCERHNVVATPNSAQRTPVRPTPTGRTRRVLRIEASPARNIRNMVCSSCPSMAECLCLEERCPFHGILTCAGCFRGNHPILQRDHERVSVKDPRARPVTREQTRSQYIPEYGSGSFAILATLFEASQGGYGGRKEYSLVESRLTKLAQRRCRSNLYDQQARGRSAFACVETLVDKGLVRKELIPGSEESKFSLLVPGEELGRWCFEFERIFEQKILTQPMKDERQAALRSTPVHLELIVDKREDASYTERLLERCRDANLATNRCDLPTGDYLFTKKSGDEMLVLPLVIERKSWSDLADSVVGKGRSRLECVRLDRGGVERQACPGSCQLCRMKRTGIAKIMFIIEGARCLGRDHENKCKNQNRCKYCREIMERHGSNVGHQELEMVLQQLQVTHGCIIHFTRGYNETIESLFHIKEILSRYHGDSLALDTYSQFCSKARSRSSPSLAALVRGRASQLAADDYIKSVKAGVFRKYVSSQLTPIPNQAQSAIVAPRNIREIPVIDDEPQSRKSSPSIQQAFGAVILEIDSDDSDLQSRRNSVLSECEDEIQVLSQVNGRTPTQKKRQEKKNRTPVVNLASESEEEIEVVASTAKRPHSCLEDDVIVVDPPPASVVRTFTAPASHKRQRVRRTSPHHDDDSVPLVLLCGMYEYDKEYWDDVNKLWKSACSGFPRDGVENFATFASTYVSASGILDEDTLPLIPRDTLLFWSLYTQLTMRVRFILTRGMVESQSIQRAWDGSSPHTVVASVSARTQDATPARRSLDFVNAVPECMICQEMIRDGKAFTTPCKHSFHADCLTAWVSRSGTRTCPQCNFRGIGLPKTPTISRTQTCPSQTQSDRPVQSGRPPRVQVSRNTKALSSAEVAREARLRRFGQGSTITLPGKDDDRFGKAESSRRFAENERSIMTGSKVSEVPCLEPRVPSFATRASIWACERCTLENTWADDQCIACSLPKPIKLMSPEVARVDSNSAARPPPSSASTRWPTISSSDKKVTCGACGLQGHNRSTATASNCRMYNTPEEVELRAKKREEAARKAQEKREEAARFEELTRSQLQQSSLQEQEVRRILEMTARQSEQFRELSEKEAARKKKAAVRAESRARRLAG